MRNRIRLAASDDAKQIVSIYGPFCGESSVSFEIVPPSQEDMMRRIVESVEEYPWLVCERDKLILGYVHANRHRERAAYRWSVDVAAYIHEDYRGRGLGKVLYSVLLDTLRLQGFFIAYAGITLPNTGSIGLHKSVGFQKIGVYHGVGYKVGAWHDVSWWELFLQPEKTHPAEPKKVKKVIRGKKWKTTIIEGERLLNEIAEP
ncbi:arsinothricin resistance N-acetyltransferase ArsN1 family B [Thermodesulfobacteriota bacterium]